jgi:hypothetical protein
MLAFLPERFRAVMLHWSLRRIAPVDKPEHCK